MSIQREKPQKKEKKMISDTVDTKLNGYMEYAISKDSREPSEHLINAGRQEFLRLIERWRGIYLRIWDSDAHKEARDSLPPDMKIEANDFIKATAEELKDTCIEDLCDRSGVIKAQFYSMKLVYNELMKKSDEGKCSSELCMSSLIHMALLHTLIEEELDSLEIHITTEGM